MSDKPRNLKFSHNVKSGAAKPPANVSKSVDKKRKSESSLPEPPSKRSKLEGVVSTPAPSAPESPPHVPDSPPATQPIEETQPFPDDEYPDRRESLEARAEIEAQELAQREEIRRQIAQQKAFVADAAAHSGVKDGPYLGWKPNLPPSASINYKLDPDRKLEGSKEVQGNWMWSGSLKGWCRYPCCGCGNYLTLDEAHAVYDFRSLIPEALARDVRNPPQYKIRPIALCTQCSNSFKQRCKANPQDYNGRGNSVWVAPF